MKTPVLPPPSLLQVSASTGRPRARLDIRADQAGAARDRGRERACIMLACPPPPLTPEVFCVNPSSPGNSLPRRRELDEEEKAREGSLARNKSISLSLWGERAAAGGAGTHIGARYENPVRHSSGAILLFD